MEKSCVKASQKSKTTTPKKFNERDTKSLLHACRKGDLLRVKQLLAAGVDPNAHDGTNGTRPLHCAACNNHTQIVSALLHAGADINAKEGFDGVYRPIEVAARAGLLEMVKFLMAKGARLNFDGGCLALSEAAVKNHLPVVKFLTKNRAKGERNLVSRAMWSLDVAMIELLIASGFKIIGNEKEEDQAIVSRAVRQDSGPAVAKLVAQHGADLVSPIGPDNDTPLHQTQHEDTALFLIEAGANIHAVNRFGDTPLHHCAKKGFTRACKLLIERGADPRTKTKRGWTPRMLAKLASREETFNFLTNALKSFTAKKKSRA